MPALEMMPGVTVAGWPLSKDSLLMTTRPETKHSRSLLARTALSVLSASLVLSTSVCLFAQDQPWPKYPPRRPPAAVPKPPAKPKPAPPSKKAPADETPSKKAPAKQPPAAQQPAPPADEAATPRDSSAPPKAGAETAPPAQAPTEPPVTEPKAPPEGAPAPNEAAPVPPAAPEEVDPATETEEGAAPASPTPEECEACPPVAAPVHPHPPAHPAGPPVPPLVTGPDELEWVEGAAIPPGYEPDTRVRKGLLIGGLVTFGVAWLGSAAAASYLIERDEYDDRTFHVGDDSGEDYPAAAPLYVPVIGPFVAIGTMQPNKQITAALVADGVVQMGGLAMALAGLIAQEQVLVRSKTASVAVVPTASPQGDGGLSLIGSF